MKIVPRRGATSAARDSWEAVWERDPGDGDVSAETPDRGDGVGGDDSGAVPSGSGAAPAADGTLPTTDGPALVDLMRMSEGEWDAYTRGSAMRRAGHSGLMRNVAIALGNWLAGSDTSDGEAVGVLLGALEDEDRVVAEAAAWALRRMTNGGPAGR